jgi:hypothetical protein
MTLSVHSILVVLAATLFAGPVVAQTTILFSDNLSVIHNWVYFDSSRVRVVGGKLVVEDEQTVIAYFTAPGGGKQTVGPNESLQVSLTLSHSDLEDERRGMRIGLFNSNAAPRPPASTPSTSERVFQGYDGYLFSWNPAPESGSNSLQLRYRTPGGQSGEEASTSLMESFEDTFSRRGVIAGTAPPLTFFAEGTDYQVTYTISRGNTSELSLTLSITGGNAANFSRTSIVSAPSTTEFNALALYSDGGVSSFAIDNVRITYTAVPEPSTYAACAGASALGLAFWRRRRAAAKALAA